MKWEKWVRNFKAPELLKEIDASKELVHAVCSHAYGICSDVEPEHEMEKILFAVDELTGLVWAAAKMRPSKSTKDMEVSSIKKKFKDKKFAARLFKRNNNKRSRNAWNRLKQIIWNDNIGNERKWR